MYASADVGAVMPATLGLVPQLKQPTRLAFVAGLTSRITARHSGPGFSVISRRRRRWLLGRQIRRYQVPVSASLSDVLCRTNSGDRTEMTSHGKVTLPAIAPAAPSGCAV